MSILTCQRCGKQVSRTGPRQLYCTACGLAVKQENTKTALEAGKARRRERWMREHPGEPLSGRFRQEPKKVVSSAAQAQSALKPPSIQEISRVARYFGLSYGELCSALERAKK